MLVDNGTACKLLPVISLCSYAKEVSAAARRLYFLTVGWAIQHWF
jgi:hypothetical protein